MNHFFSCKNPHLYFPCVVALVEHAHTHTHTRVKNAHPVHVYRCIHVVNISWLEQQGWNGFKGCHGGAGKHSFDQLVGEESKGRANRHSFVLEGRWERESKSQAWWGDEAVCLWKRGYANEAPREEGQKNGGEREEGVGEGERGQKTIPEGSQLSRSSRRSKVTGGKKRAWTAPE